MQTTFAIETVRQSLADVWFKVKFIKSDGTDFTGANVLNFTCKILGPDKQEVTGFTAPTVTEFYNGEYIFTFGQNAQNMAFDVVSEIRDYGISISHSALTGSSAEGRITIKQAVNTEAQTITAIVTAVWAAVMTGAVSFGAAILRLYNWLIKDAGNTDTPNTSATVSMPTIDGLPFETVMKRTLVASQATKWVRSGNIITAYASDGTTPVLRLTITDSSSEVTYL